MNVSAFQNAYLSRVNTIIQSEEINLRVAEALSFVVRNVFAKIANAFVFTLSTSGGATEFWLHDIMRKIFSTWGLIAVQLVILDSKTIYVDVSGTRYCNMILVDSFENLKKTNIAEYNRNSDRLEYYFIFLQTEDSMFATEMEKVSKYCFDNYWIDCNIMAQNSRGEILVYTYFPFKENNCFKTQPELINVFIGNKFGNATMFPNKLNNLQGCSLKLSTWEAAPFVINSSNSSRSSVAVAGFEIFAMMTISQKMNFSLDIEWLPVEAYNEFESPETILISKLKNYDTNFTMGYFRRTADRDEIATPTFSTYYIPVVAITLRKRAIHKTMTIWTFPFDNATWIIMLVLYILIGMLNIFHSTRFKGSIFEIFEVVIGMPVNNLPKEDLNRLRFLTAIISSFILRSIYQSLLFYMFRTNLYQPTPLTFDDLVQVGYKAVATELTFPFLLYVPQIQDKTLPITVINNTSEMYPLRYLELYQNESIVAMSITEFAIRYVREELEHDKVLQILPINVKDQQICLYLPKHSFYSDRLNQYILYFHQAGLFNIWKEWTMYIYQVIQTEKPTVFDNTFIVNLNHLIGFLILVVLLFLTSILIFILELIWNRFLNLVRSNYRKLLNG